MSADRHSTLIVARMDAASSAEVAGLFAEFDRGEMPGLMGTRRRQLFHYRGLYFHLQDFDGGEGAERIEAAKGRAEFVRISADLKPFITAYDPETWRSPKDAMAERFYHWSAEQGG
ncbi:TcmI family type II polyketide cyclase [Amycolatopsis magusensis]|uniref:TcmI family type II polyketide cyclase n=1 Tax=Amycolatopsis magusensis TaxID=882444 RepID=UPI003C2BAEE5